MKRVKLVEILGWLCINLIAQSPFLFGQSKADCLTCHSDSSLTKEQAGKQISLYVNEPILNISPHKKLVCTACHAGFKADDIPHKANITPVNCLTCHKNDVHKHSFHPQLSKAISEGTDPDVSCKDCHGTHDVVSPKIVGSKFHVSKLDETCGECHSDVTEKFTISAHGKAVNAGIQGAPNCLTCHRHDITRVDETHDSLSQTTAKEKLCLSCHLDNPEVRSRTSPSAGFIASYEQSVHGAALRNGNKNTATCIDCHGSHEMSKGLEPSSLTNKANIPQTCSKCHETIAKEFEHSVHGVAVTKGNMDAPVCTDCHGEHNILSPSDPRSPVAEKNVSAQVCSPCHSSVALSAKYGLANDRFKTFSDSYHGLAIEGGSVGVANCASCHGSHNIKPSSDSTSTIHKSNLPATCGKCHPGANERFAVGLVHVTMDEAEDPVLYWIANLYLIMIVAVIGGMFVHNLLDFIKKSKRTLMIRRGLVVHEHRGHALYVRMTLNERVQHMMLLVSFITLAVTGFMLRFPETWWVQGIRSLSGEVFELRSLIHRIAGVVMIAASLYHCYYAAATERGRKLIQDLLPTIQDGKDAVAVLKFNLGFSTAKPKFGRFSYIEKSEYWALVWGTIVMAVTGAIMWFDNTFIGLFTKLGYDISRTIHYYEAWLATLAIIVWHIYYVVFNPDIYPINLAFWKGTLTEEEMAEEHPLQLEEIERRKALEKKEETSANQNHDSEEKHPE